MNAEDSFRCWQDRVRWENQHLSDRHKLCAIEVKSGRRTSNKGMGLFREHFHPQLSLIVGSGVMPVDEFLALDIKELFMA